jgi:5-methyltetrahydrofolate--homocysteine methyltransferase
MDDSGIPETPEARFAVAETIAERAARLNIPLERLVFDPLVMTVGNDHRAIVITADTARLIRSQLGCNMTVGASNASHGMPERELLNTVLLAVLISVGINAPICNPAKNALAVRATDLILGRDEWAMNYIQTYRKLSAQKET